MELHLKIIGALLIVLALIHIIFPRYFNWKAEFAGITLINRQMMYVHTFFIALTILLIGLLCLTSSYEMVHTTLGSRLSLGLFIFWIMRLFIQFFYYSSALWKGKRWETTLHILFSFLWTYLSITFFLVFWTNKTGLLS